MQQGEGRGGAGAVVVHCPGATHALGHGRGGAHKWVAVTSCWTSKGQVATLELVLALNQCWRPCGVLKCAHCFHPKLLTCVSAPCPPPSCPPPPPPFTPPPYTPLSDEEAFKRSVECITGPISKTISTQGMPAVYNMLDDAGKKVSACAESVMRVVSGGAGAWGAASINRGGVQIGTAD